MAAKSLSENGGRHMKRCILFACLLCVSANPAVSQTVSSTAGAVNGTVSDSTKAVLPGVTVTLSGPATPECPTPLSRLDPTCRLRGWRTLAAAVDRLREQLRAEGIEPVRRPIRGGTDGSGLSEMGLPTPNIFTGGHEYHSPREWASVQDMAASAATIIRLAEVWTRPQFTAAAANNGR